MKTFGEYVRDCVNETCIISCDRCYDEAVIKELREENSALKAQIERMKNHKNCRNWDNATECYGAKCPCEKWEARG